MMKIYIFFLRSKQIKTKLIFLETIEKNYGRFKCNLKNNNNNFYNLVYL